MPTLSRKTYLFIGVAVLLGGGLLYARLSKPKTQLITEAISRGTVISEISVTGSIAAKTKVTLQPETVGKVTQIFVKEGDTVTVGQALLSLDDRDIVARVAAQRAALEAAKAQLTQLRAGATPEEIRVAEAAVATATTQRDAAVAAKADSQTALDNSGKNLEAVKARAASYLQSKVDAFLIDYDQASYVAGDAVNRLTSGLYTTTNQLSFSSSSAEAQSRAEASRGTARAALPNIQSAVSSVKIQAGADSVSTAWAGIMSDLSRVNEHLNDSAAVLNYAPSLSAATLSSYQANTNTAQSNMNTVMQELTTDKTGLDTQEKTNDADIQTAQTALSNARAALTVAANAALSAENALTQAKANLDLKRAPTRPEQIAAQEARVHAESAALDGLLTDLSKRTIAASIDAVVTDIPVTKGETISPGQAAVVLNTKGNFEIVSNVSEIDIAKVKVGDQVAITLDAFSGGQKWTGKVVSIQPAEKVVEGVVFYETKVLFDAEDERLRSGMTANLEIEAGRREGVLRLPIRAIKEKAGRKSVQILRDGQTTESDVEIGLENTEYVEVLRGVTEGDLVVTGTQ